MFIGFFEKFQWVFVIIAMFLGLAIGQSGNVAQTAEHLIVPFLVVMLFGVFLQTPIESLKTGFKNSKIVKIVLVINFIWTPLLAYGLSAFFFKDSPDVYVALIMDLVTPCTDWYLIFTAIAGGNLALSTALLPWNLFMQLILMPVYLFIFAGTMVEIQPAIFLQSFVKVLFVPFIIAVVIRHIIISQKGERWFAERILERLGVFQAVFLLFAITAMFASQGAILFENLGLVVRLIFPVALFFAINFSLGQLIVRAFRLTYQDGVSVIITTMARNAPLALTIAAATFSERPLIPLVLVVESLIELPLLFAFSQLLILICQKKWWPSLS